MPHEMPPFAKIPSTDKKAIRRNSGLGKLTISGVPQKSHPPFRSSVEVRPFGLDDISSSHHFNTIIIIIAMEST